MQPRAPDPRPQRPAGDPPIPLDNRPNGYDAAAVYALNFYSPVVADQLRHRRKTATIRLGDKSTKYKKGMVVSVLAGQRFGVREKIFDAVIDKVEVKALRDVSPREIQHDNPEIRHIEEFCTFLGQLYNRPVGEEDTVTVIHFSEIRG
jgi:hypothetical protein